ncbi:hypothetical protein BJ138DRAFT_1099152 [Hygrophoropsis aurantiaca]|uniref:Uncharacterized protein n=1 Tax=Hygrophoropsis aurantiaca TaxID=72124 RepID=A0ACB8AKY3_9AGAM|nr:hypothetical protein BJ138DRAFT_1099152 [Hygrophoropsis aurantiaca]
MSTSSGSGRRLSVRRGSVSAGDAFGLHADINDDPNRSGSSRLTIVRVGDQLPPSISPISAYPHTTHPHTPATRSLRRANAPQERLSFAFTSFGGSGSQPSSPTSPRPPALPSPRASPRASPTSSPRLRPSSPSGRAGSGFGRSSLSADQLVALARDTTQNIRSAQTPGITLVADDVYLPFLHRSAEVSALIGSAPTARLFSLLAQTIRGGTDTFDADPRTWSYTTLVRWLTAVDRDEANDSDWVGKARRCVVAHSELIWERMKGALGVPPDLDHPDHPDSDAILINIEPLSPAPQNDLQDIGEEDEADGADAPLSPSPSSSIHGLRISTDDGQFRQHDGDYDDDDDHPYDPVGDRVPGNPIFPSNFARLALGPTLSANNPSLRARHRVLPVPRAWSYDARTKGNFEYALTVGSGSSIGIGGVE